MTTEGNQFVLDLFKMAEFPPLDAQAQELIRLGMPGIGYLLLSPKLHADGGFNGRKRVAYEQKSAESLDKWVLDLHHEGYTPIFRYYFLSAADTMDSAGIKNLVVHRARYGDLVAVVESVPDLSKFDAPGAKKIPKMLSRAMDAPSVAQEFATMVAMGRMGVDIQQSYLGRVAY